MSIKFHKIREVESPSRANPTDAGIDFFVPSFTKQFRTDLLEKNPFLKIDHVCKRHKTDSMSYTVDKNPYKLDENGMYFELEPHQRILIPSGIKCKMDNNICVQDICYHKNVALIAFNKSGVASKLGLDIGSSVVDSSYQGEIHISLINTSNDTVKIYEKQKIIQFIELPIYTSDIEIVGSEEELYNGVVTERGEKGFGAHDNK